MSVITEFREGALVVTINRPDAGNSLNGAVGKGLVEALERANNDVEVRTVIVTGAGEKIFCAGMDLKAFAAGEDISPVAKGLDLLAKCVKPVIAAVNGIAVAGGFEVMMKADLVVAAEHAKFGIPEVKRGLFAAGGGYRLPTRIPLQVALEMGLTGDPIDARRALELGIINRVVPAADVMEASLALAAAINANGPLAVQATKRLMLAEIAEPNMTLFAELQRQVFGSADAKEGSRAFAEKRPPVWRGE